MKLKNQEYTGSLNLMNCTLCESTNIEVAFFKNKYRILQCKNCNHLFTDLLLTPGKVDEIYSDDYFFGGGAGYDDYTLEKDMLFSRGEYYADKISRFMTPGKVLDIGSAPGFILKGFENKGWPGTGIEPNASMAEHGRTIVGVNIKKGTLASVKLEEKFDLIILIQVIGHFDNLNSSINKISNYLKPGGHILNYFSKITLKDIMCKYDFSLVGQGTPKKKIYSKHFKSFVKYEFLESKRLKWMAAITSLIPENIVIPYPSEDLFWALFKNANKLKTTSLCQDKQRSRLPLSVQVSQA